MKRVKSAGKVLEYCDMSTSENVEMTVINRW